MKIVSYEAERTARGVRKATRLGGLAALIGSALMFGWSGPGNVAGILSGDPLPMRTVNFPICSSGLRNTCIVDGDTFWLDGEKFRLSGFNAPEMNGVCPSEREKARLARSELRRILSRPFSLDRTGQDRYGRTLVVVRTEDGDVTDAMVGAGLAHVWSGFKESWC